MDLQEIEKLKKFCMENNNYVPFSFALEKLGIKYHNLYKFFRSGRHKGIFEIYKEDGLQIIKLAPSTPKLQPPLDTGKAKLKPRAKRKIKQAREKVLRRLNTLKIYSENMNSNDILNAEKVLDLIILRLNNENSNHTSTNELLELRKLYNYYQYDDAINLVDLILYEMKFVNPVLRTIGRPKSDELFFVVKYLKKWGGWGQTHVRSDGKRYFKFASEQHKIDYFKCVAAFKKWLENADGKRLVFINLDGEIVYKPYKTRFTDNSRKAALREKYEDLFQNGAKVFQEASFVTLTTNPEKFDNMYEANKEMSKNWNKFITFLKKHYKNHLTGRKMMFINVREFQKNGRLHMHAIIYGVTLFQDIRDPKKNIFTNSLVQEAWERYGQGSITNTIPLKFNKQQQKLTWYRQKPRDCKKNEDPMQYLKKYLKKVLEGNVEPNSAESTHEYINAIDDIAINNGLSIETATAVFNAETLFQYFANNCRFYTYSPALLSEEMSAKLQILKEHKKYLAENFPLRLVGVFDLSTGIYNTAIS